MGEPKSVIVFPGMAGVLPSTPLGEVMERWILWRDPAARTIEQYRGGLARLAEHGILTVADACDNKRISRFQEARRRQGVDVETIRINVTSATTLLTYLEERDELPQGTVAAVQKVRRTRARKQEMAELAALMPEQVKVIGDFAEELDPQLALAIWVVWWAGLRLNEMRRLRVEHIDLDSRLVKVRGRTKNWKERDVSMELPLRRILEARLPAEGFLFPAKRPKTHGRERALVSEEALRDGLHRAADLAKVTELDVDWILLRRSCAARWIRYGGTEGEPMNELKLTKLMGHSARTSRRFYQAFLAGYDSAVETTLEGKTEYRRHWSEAATKGVVYRPQGYTTTRALTPQQLALVQRIEKDEIRKRGKQ